MPDQVQMIESLCEPILIWFMYTEYASGVWRLQFRVKLNLLMNYRWSLSMIP